VEKKLPETLAEVLTPEAVGARPVRVLFQDEARFGRMAKARRCWAPAPLRPKVTLALVREFLYAYAAVSPLQGDLDWTIGPKMNTQHMQHFLDRLSGRYPEEFLVMILDGASSHRSKDLHVPANVRLIPLPPYAPELNPVEHLWDELREKEFANRVFDSLAAVQSQLEAGLAKMQADHPAIRSLTAWPWISNLNLSAT